MKNVDLTHRILELVGKPRVADQAGRRSAGPRSPLLARHRRSCESLGWKPPRARSRRVSRETVAVVSRQRVVVAADQGRGSGVPQVLPGTVRQPLSDRVAGLPLITGATGFAGGHLLDRLVVARQDGARVGAPGIRRRPTADGGRHRARSATWKQRSSMLRSTRRSRDGAARSRRGPRSSITAPAQPTSRTRGAHRRARCASTPSAPTTCSRPRAKRALTCRVLVTGSALVYRPGTDALTEEAPLGRPARTASASWRRR